MLFLFLATFVDLVQHGFLFIVFDLLDVFPAAHTHASCIQLTISWFILLTSICAVSALPQRSIFTLCM